MTKDDIKSQHHFVWKHYLRGWAEDHQCRKYVWRNTEKTNKVEKFSVNGIFVDSKFYKINKLDKYQLEMIRYLFKDSSIFIRQSINKFLDVNSTFNLINMNFSNEEISYYHALYESNTLENFHTEIESKAKLIIDPLKMGDFSILENTENLVVFIQFISQQLFRTKSYKENMILTAKKLDQVLAVKMEECWAIIAFFMGINFGFDLWVNRANNKYCLLLNETDEDFITSDYPVINVHPATEIINLDRPIGNDEVDLYYPISPKIACMINSSSKFPQGKVKVSLAEVERLNIKIAKMANKGIIGNSEKIVKKYKVYIGKWHEKIKKDFEKNPS